MRRITLYEKWANFYVCSYNYDLTRFDEYFELVANFFWYSFLINLIKINVKTIEQCTLAQVALLLSSVSESQFIATFSWSVMSQIYGLFLFSVNDQHIISTQSAKFKDHASLKSSSQTHDTAALVKTQKARQSVKKIEKKKVEQKSDHSFWCPVQ